jgi:hypothetical protein
VYSPGPSDGAGALACGNVGLPIENAPVALLGRFGAAGPVGLAWPGTGGSEKYFVKLCGSCPAGFGGGCGAPNGFDGPPGWGAANGLAGADAGGAPNGFAGPVGVGGAANGVLLWSGAADPNSCCPPTGGALNIGAEPGCEGGAPGLWNNAVNEPGADVG